MGCNCTRSTTTTWGGSTKTPKTKKHPINPDKIVEVAAYRCEEGHILIDADGPDHDVVQALYEEMGQEPRVRIKPREAGAPLALKKLGLPPRSAIHSDHKWGETTCGKFLAIAKKFPFNR